MLLTSKIHTSEFPTVSQEDKVTNAFQIQRIQMAAINRRKEPFQVVGCWKSREQSLWRWQPDLPWSSLGRTELRLGAAVFFRECPGARLAPSTTPESMEPENFFLIAPSSHKCEIIV